MKIRLTILFLSASALLFGQIPSVDFDYSGTSCRNETIEFNNLSTLNCEYSWDFCTGDFLVTPSIQTNISTTVVSSSTLKVVNHSGQFYGFAIQRDRLYRFNFGNNINSSPTVNDLGSFGGLIANSEGLDIIEEAGQWIGFVGFGCCANGGNVTRLVWTDLSQTPTASDMGSFGFATGRIREIQLVNDNGNKVLAFMSSAGNFGLINFGSSYLNSIQSSDITTSSILSGVSNVSSFNLFVKDGNWTLVTNSIVLRRISIFQLGTSVYDSPVFIKSQDFPAYPFLSKLKIIPDGGKYYGLIAAAPELHLLDLKNLGAIDTFEEISLPSQPSSAGLDVVKIGSSYKAFTVRTNLNRLDFSNTCQVSLDQSTEFEPTVNYSAAGTYAIDLTVTSANGTTNYSSQNITISAQTAPPITYSTNNACATASSNFTPSTTGLTYSWDFDEDGLEDSDLENPSFAFGAPGTYTVRLDVDDGTCHNFTTQDITLYEEPPVPAFNISGDLCTTNTLTFGNTTDDAAYAGPLTYAWDFNGEGSSALKNPSFAFATPGLKIITLTSSIPGCEHVSQQQVEIIAGPVASFSANPICQGELMSFTNSSTGADTYFWDFGDGFTSTQSNPGHVYSAGGNFTVSLYATETSGCTTLYQQEVAVSHLPNAQFDYDIPCSGSQGIAFYDLSSVTGADILFWNWFVDNVFTSTVQNPTLSFDEAGSRVIRLEVMSSNGCSATAEETIQVLGTPLPSFDAEINCQGQTSTFTDTTLGTVISRLWNINGQNYTTATVNHVFAASGDLNVSLTVTSSDFCTSTTSSMVSVTPAPTMGFSISSLCLGDNILLTDNSTSTDPIVSRTWTLDGNPFFNGTQALLTNATPGAHTLALQVETTSGCSFTTSQNLTLLASPVAGFSSSATAGVPPFPVTFTNSSTGATGYVWRVNGTQVSTSTNLTQVFSQLGNQIVELTAINADGCESKMSTTISSVTPAIDLQVRNVQVISIGAGSNVTVTIGNEGNLPIEIFDLIVRTGNDSQVSERFNSYVGIGEEVSVGFSSTLQMGNANRLCVSVVSAYTDIHPDDNDACINYSSHIILEHPYPNPITDEATFRLILPSEKSVQLTVTHVSGRMLINEQFNDLSSGLHILRYDASQWKKGIYLVTVRSGSDVVTRKIVVD